MEYSVSTLKTNTIQAATGTTVNVASGQVLTQPGSVIQTLNATTSTGLTTTSGTLADVGLSVTITPKFASSKILVNVCQNGFQKSAHDTSAKHILLRGSSEISILATPLGYNASTNTEVSATSGITFLDSPSTTSATTYKTQFCRISGSGTVYFQTSTSGQSKSTITLMEIAG